MLSLLWLLFDLLTVVVVIVVAFPLPAIVAVVAWLFDWLDFFAFESLTLLVVVVVGSAEFSFELDLCWVDEATVVADDLALLFVVEGWLVVVDDTDVVVVVDSSTAIAGCWGLFCICICGVGAGCCCWAVVGLLESGCIFDSISGTFLLLSTTDLDWFSPIKFCCLFLYELLVWAGWTTACCCCSGGCADVTEASDGRFCWSVLCWWLADKITTRLLVLVVLAAVDGFSVCSTDDCCWFW